MTAATLRRRLQELGPGILLTGTAVGAGDLLTTALAGSEAGLAILWAVPAGVLIKWTISEGIARWQMASGQTLLEGWMRQLGGWIQWIFLPYLLLFALVVGGALTNACGVAATAMLAIGDPAQSKAVWGIVHALAGLALVWTGSFALFKGVMTACVLLMFLAAIVTVLLLPISWGAVFQGLLPTVPPSGMSWVLALLGGIGGTMTLLSYCYWIREEGRAGRQGLNQCRADLAVSYMGTAVFAMAMLIIGTRIRLQGEGTDLAYALASQLGGAAGPAGRWLFLIGFWGTVFSSLLGVWQSLPWIFTDFLNLREGLAAREHDGVRSRRYRLFLLALATLPLLLLARPVRQVQWLFGVFAALFLPLLIATLLLLNNRRVQAPFRNGITSNAMLTLALVFFGWLGWREIAALSR